MHNSNLIILDRDGVINFDSPDYIKSLDDWRPIPSSIEAIVNLYKSNYRFAIASNQSGIGRNMYTSSLFIDIFNSLNDTLSRYGVKINIALYCPHVDADNCLCRKPKPLMLSTICSLFGVQPQNVPFVGDNVTDLFAAVNAGCKPIYVDTGYKSILSNEDLPPTTLRFSSLLEYSNFLLNP